MRWRRWRGLRERDRFTGPIVPFGALGHAASIASSAAAVLPEACVPFLFTAATVLQAIEVLASNVGRRARSWRRGRLARRWRWEIAFVIRHDRALDAVLHLACLRVAPLRGRRTAQHTRSGALRGTRAQAHLHAPSAKRSARPSSTASVRPAHVARGRIAGVAAAVACTWRVRRRREAAHDQRRDGAHAHTALEGRESAERHQTEDSSYYLTSKPGRPTLNVLSIGGASHARDELCDRGVGCVTGGAVAVAQFVVAEPMRDAAQVVPPRQDLFARHREKRAQ